MEADGLDAVVEHGGDGVWWSEDEAHRTERRLDLLQMRFSAVEMMSQSSKLARRQKEISRRRRAASVVVEVLSAASWVGRAAATATRAKNTAENFILKRDGAGGGEQMEDKVARSRAKSGSRSGSRSRVLIVS